MVRVRTCLLLLGLLLLTAALSASATVVGELTFKQELIFDDKGASSAPFTPEISVLINSPSAASVRGEIALHLLPQTTDWNAAIERAYLRARLPHGRITVGKAPLVWGTGLFFNVANLTGSEPVWLTSYYLPIGSMNYAELVYLPSIDAREAQAGSRLYLSPGSLTIEGAYLAPLDRWDDHRVGLSVQGHLGLDWWAAASASPSAWDESAFSGGLFYSHAFLGAQTLSVRPEVQVDLDGAYALALQGVYAPSLSTSITVFAQYDSSKDTLLMQAGLSLSLPEALWLSADVQLTLQKWAYHALALEIGCSWRF